MELNGKTRLCGLLAYPAGHSMSPMLHGLFAERTGTNLVYCPFEVPPDRLGDAVRGAFALGVLGLNVTVPHKQHVMEYLEEIDESAARIGAVNTLVRTETGFCGYNTDYIGLKRSLQKEGMEIQDRDCILIGAGGAAKAAAYLLATEGAARVYVLNRTLEKAEALCAYMDEIAGRELAKGLSLEQWEEIPCKNCLAIQTTSVGMHPAVDTAPILEPGFYQKIEAALDIVYNPSRTRFLELAAKAGGRNANGLDMLVYQGAAAFERWNPGVQVPEDVLMEAARRIREALR